MNFKVAAAAAAAAKHESTEEFLEHKRKKRWIDNKCGYDCFMLHPRSLYGCHWSNRQYWGLEVLQRNKAAYGWEAPIILKLTLPNGRVQNRQVSLLGRSPGDNGLDSVLPTS